MLGWMGSKVSVPIGVRVRQGCVMSPWLFDILMAGCMREMKAEVGFGHMERKK